MAGEYGLAGRVAAITGGGGVLCGALGAALAAEGVPVALLDIRLEAAERQAAAIRAAGGTAQGAIEGKLGPVDILVNGAGGNVKDATVGPDRPYFDLPPEAMRRCFDLNILGTMIPSQVFGKSMAARKRGAILNISSMNALRPLTRVVAYSAAKAGVSNFTQWLAVYMAKEFSPAIRVNALAPGFFLTDQNRELLLEGGTGPLTARGQSIVSHTPMGRFGEPGDLGGAALFLLSDRAGFITGVVLPVDGGFSAFSGV